MKAIVKIFVEVSSYPLDLKVVNTIKPNKAASPLKVKTLA